MSGIGEYIEYNARLEDLQHMIEIGLISNYDTAKKLIQASEKMISRKSLTLLICIPIKINQKE